MSSSTIDGESPLDTRIKDLDVENLTHACSDFGDRNIKIVLPLLLHIQ